ncbi:MAG: ABC transporter ATP-binding protein [Chitinophagales bacterium]|nr:ABC transporter ATP-binding protein [Chitinophagales bacterium]MDW8427026.1 ABC transporter ATP-binding protein [Chitinophagales bacterium]
MEAIVSLQSVRKAFGRIVAVDELSFEVLRGDLFGFLGPNGSGKSTTLRLLTGLVRADAGRIFLFGSELSLHRQNLMRRIGCLIERPDFYGYLSGRRNLEILARLSGVDNTHARIREVLELVGLKGRENDLVKTYSHGMKQRLGIAQALLHRPELLILDEPTVGLDPQGLHDIRQLLRQLAQQGITILLSSHLLSEVEQIATRMAIIHQGKLLAQGSVAELLSARELVVKVETDAQALATLQQSRWQQSLIAANGMELQFQLSRQQIPELAAFLHQHQHPIYRITYQRPLEEYFLRLTGTNLSA